MCLDSLADVSSALLTPLIAVVATYIAWQQHKTNRERLNLERYDRSLRIYEEVKKILSIVMREGKADVEDLLKFRTNASEADFLFGAEIAEYIGEIYSHGIKLHRWNAEYRDYTQVKLDGYDHAKVVGEMHKELEWLSQQFDPAKELFAKYLRIGR
jgi:hypothetical protein